MENRKIFIQQPYFFPWLGFLAKLAKAHHYIALDNAPFRRNHLHRSSIFAPNGKKIWLSCPLGASQGTPISSIYLPKDTKYVFKMIKTIKHSYRGTNYFNEEINIVEALFYLYHEYAESKLSDVNIILINEIIKYFNIRILSIEKESSFELSTDKNEKTIELSKMMNSSCIVCGDGGSTKVHNISLFIENGLSLNLINCFSKHPKYFQKHTIDRNNCFIPGLSFIDALFNIGRNNVIEMINNGFPAGEIIYARRN